MVLGLDFETYSEADIGKVGSYRYIEDPSFEPLLVAYAYDDEVPTVIDLTIEPMPQQLLEDMLNPDILKTAWNVAFERKVLHRAWGVYSPPEQWQDTMILAGVNGLPMSLGGCGKALMLPQDSAKDAEGKRLIKYFCSPCKPSKVNKGRTRNLPEHAPLKWEKFIDYNRQDVVAERAIRKILEKQYVPDETEHQFWCLDSRINWNGINIDTQLAEQAVRLSERNTAELTEQAVAVTGLSNPGSIQQVKEWLEAQEGIAIPSLNKKSVADVVAALTSDRAKEFMTLRSELAKTSVKKYEAMVRCCGEDHHAKGCFAFYGANRTGRFAGRLIQLQNLPQNHMEDLDECRQLVKAGDYDSVQFLWGSISNPLSELIRTALIPEDGCKWIVADFSAIEARVIAWIAQETWRLETFRNGGDIYCASASQMFKVPVEKHGQNAHLRQKGKVAELACIAEGQLVLTDKGLVPIEQVTTDHKVWDGIEWVNHEGVVYRGEKEVLSYGGLEGTEDHIVWATIRGQARKIRLGDAAARGAHLIQAGDGRSPIRVGEDYKPGEEMERLMESLLRSDGMHGMRTAAMDQFYQSEKRQIKRMSELLTATDCSALVRQKVYCGKAEMREPKRRKLQKLWSKRNKVLLQQRNRSLPLYDRKLWNPIKRDGAGQNRCGWKLRSGKSQMGYPPGELPKPEKVLKKVYDIRNAGPRHRFTVSGILVHNCGYGGGVNALKAFGADKMGLTEEEMGQIISDWRASSPRIVQLWRSLENAFIRCIRDKVPTRSTIGGICFNIRDGVGWMTLPSGRKIAYPGVTYAEGNGKYSTGRKIISFMGVNQLTKKWERIETFGGRLTENCWSGDTPVLTQSGWKPIKDIEISDLIYDGENFVSHGGVIPRGRQRVYCLNGAWVTPEHRILTTRGWRYAKDCDGLDGVQVQLPDGYRTDRQLYRRRKAKMARQMRVRRGAHYAGNGHKKERGKAKGNILWVPNEENPFRKKADPRYDKPSGVLGLAQYATALYRANTQGLEELRRKRHNRVRQMGKQFREFLGGYGTNLSKRIGIRPRQQRAGILPRELPMGRQKNEQPKQAWQCIYRHPWWEDACEGGRRDKRNKIHDAALSARPGSSGRIDVQKTRLHKSVFDILNCGPNHRYVVLTDRGPLIVHNCVQATARDCLRDCMMALNAEGYDIRAHVHDEVIISEPRDSGRGVKDVVEIMSRELPWAKGLPLTAAGYEGDYYFKD